MWMSLDDLTGVGRSCHGVCRGMAFASRECTGQVDELLFATGKECGHSLHDQVTVFRWASLEHETSAIYINIL